MSDKPRTDAVFYLVYNNPAHATDILKSHMEKLELEAASAKVECLKWKACAEKLAKEIKYGDNNDVAEALDAEERNEVTKMKY